ncbi:hypothetical protein D049_4019B, partial [Vibrio parahaemolyticus VPTS-2010]
SRTAVPKHTNANFARHVWCTRVIRVKY